MQTHQFSWLTPKRTRALTVAVMSGAAIFATIGFSGATPPAQRSSSPSAHAVPAQR